MKEWSTNGFKKARQFIIISSREFQELLWGKVKALYENLLKDGVKNIIIAKKKSYITYIIQYIIFNNSCSKLITNEEIFAKFKKFFSIIS